MNEHVQLEKLNQRERVLWQKWENTSDPKYLGTILKLQDKRGKILSEKITRSRQVLENAEFSED
jgi:hypothetical protein